MKAIILTAGLGTRLQPLTEERPKALFPIVNRPIIDIIINNLKSVGVCYLGINLHHMPEQICDYLKDGKKHGVGIEYRFEEQILETGGGLANFAGFIGDDSCFIVHNCDILSNVDLNDAMEFHQNMNPAATLIVVDYPPHNTVLVNRYCQIKDIRGKLGALQEKGDRMLCGAGIFLYNREIFDWLPGDRRPYPLIPSIMKLLRRQPGSVLAYVPQKDYYWKDIGSTVNYIETHRDLLTRKLVRFHGTYPPDDGLWIHRNSDVAKTAIFKGFVSIGKEASVGEGAKLEDCIVWDGAVVPPGSEYVNVVIGRDNIARG